MTKRLKSGYTTGACAAAAAKAAAEGFLTGRIPRRVNIPFPDGSRVEFHVEREGKNGSSTFASVIKDAGDDIDVTRGAEIMALVGALPGSDGGPLVIKGGPGVGLVTKPGLAQPPGEAAINPIPRRMICEAVAEVHPGLNKSGLPALEVTICVPEGERLAGKTLNARLGIIGGISILGTTGMVIPVSSAAWVDTINSALRVARAMGHREIVLSTGRSSERAHEKTYMLPEEAYILMGDYVETALLAACDLGFSKIHLAAQWGKLLKISMGKRQTHVRFGMLAADQAAAFLRALGGDFPNKFHNARELFHYIRQEMPDQAMTIFRAVCRAARAQAEIITQGRPVAVHLVSYEGKLLAASDEP